MKEDTDKILQIQLMRTPRKDQYLCHYDKHGQHFVKSGYELALKLKFSDNPRSSDSSQNQWSIIWSSELPKKLRFSC